MKQLHEYILCNMMQKSYFFPYNYCLTMKEYKMHPENWENYEAHLKKTNVYVQYFFYIFSCWSESESILNTHAHIE